jgi:hypothetical protein
MRCDIEEVAKGAYFCHTHRLGVWGEAEPLRCPQGEDEREGEPFPSGDGDTDLEKIKEAGRG